MKRIIIIFIIAVCLLSFTGIFSLAKEHPIAGELWNDINMSDTFKNIYLQGIAGGFLLSGTVTGNTELTHWNNFIIQNWGAIIRVMNDLYKDPANTYIDWSLICLIACQKLKGEDIEQFLKDSRKFAYQKYQRVIEE